MGNTGDTKSKQRLLQIVEAFRELHEHGNKPTFSIVKKN